LRVAPNVETISEEEHSIFSWRNFVFSLTVEAELCWSEAVETIQAPSIELDFEQFWRRAIEDTHCLSPPYFIQRNEH
jgi:hypothetical protein